MQGVRRKKITLSDFVVLAGRDSDYHDNGGVNRLSVFLRTGGRVVLNFREIKRKKFIANKQQFTRHHYGWDQVVVADSPASP